MKRELEAIFTSQGWEQIQQAITCEQQFAIDRIAAGNGVEVDMTTIAAVQRMKNRVIQLAAEYELPNPFKE